jgi:hypothetical protein
MPNSAAHDPGDLAGDGTIAQEGSRGTLVLGHGVEADGVFYCCAHCAKHSGVKGVSDRAA